MPYFEFEAMSPKGRVVRDTVDAPDVDDAIRQIQERGLFVTGLTERGPAGERIPHFKEPRLAPTLWERVWPWLMFLVIGLPVVVSVVAGWWGLVAVVGWLGWPDWTALPIGYILLVGAALVATRWLNRHAERQLAELERSSALADPPADPAEPNTAQEPAQGNGPEGS